MACSTSLPVTPVRLILKACKVLLVRCMKQASNNMLLCNSLQVPADNEAPCKAVQIQEYEYFHEQAFQGHCWLTSFSRMPSGMLNSFCIIVLFALLSVMKAGGHITLGKEDGPANLLGHRCSQCFSPQCMTSADLQDMLQCAGAAQPL